MGVLGRAATAQAVHTRAGDSEILRLHAEFVNRAVLNGEHGGGTRERHFIHAIIPMHHIAPFEAQFIQGVGHPGGRIQRRRAHHLRSCGSGV